VTQKKGKKYVINLAKLDLEREKKMKGCEKEED
jgi:hypothetical protein